MPQKKDNSKATQEVKRLQSDIKGGQGTFFLAVIVSMIYTVRVLLAGNFSFFFSLFVPEVLLKSASFTANMPSTFSATYGSFFTELFQGRLPNLWLWIALAVFYGGCILLAVLARNHHMLVIWELVIYGLDTLLLFACHLLGFPEMFSLNALIDPIFHLFVLILVIRSVSATVKLKKRGFAEKDLDFYSDEPEKQ